MSDAITSHLQDMMADTLTAQPITQSQFGGITNDGAALSVPCYISVRNRMIRNEQGQEVVSSAKATCGEVNNLNTKDFRYTLPSRFTPRSNLEAIAVKSVSDENGAHHEVVYLP